MNVPSRWRGFPSLKHRRQRKKESKKKEGLPRPSRGVVFAGSKLLSLRVWLVGGRTLTLSLRRVRGDGRARRFKAELESERSIGPLRLYYGHGGSPSYSRCRSHPSFFPPATTLPIWLHAL